jgi:hypothetical protein
MKNNREILSNWLISIIIMLFGAPDLFSQTSVKVFPGADNRTPSRSEYESWINNTNEGSTERQTLINLDFFAWLKSEYGMVLDIYVISAGTIDKAGWYGSTGSPEFRSQFPNGLGPIYERAALMNTRLGTWGGPDGFGTTPEDEKKRHNMIVSLSRDYNFELLKFDAVVGQLRPEKQEAFIRMMTDCRQYTPDLILLNHRLELGEEGSRHATTKLWDGEETYIDVHMANDQTAPHHRAGAISRNVVPELRRLTEDHGVCISSCLDYWEDDLILQAFNRNLILAPQIYGNPWLLRDEEYPRLAGIFNLARKYKDILVDGIILPDTDYGEKAVSRGNDKIRVITLRNTTWMPVIRNIRLDREIGLVKASSVELRQYHPVERVFGRFNWGETIRVEVLPFRSCLLIATSEKQPGISVEGCEYEIVRDVVGKSQIINLLGFPGEKKTIHIKGAARSVKQAFLDGKPVKALLKGGQLEISFPGTLYKEKYHRKLGEPAPVPVPADAEALYEATCFAADNNALEARSLIRSGPTAIPQVRMARDAFFAQELFVDRGLWDRNLFDGKLNTAFYPGRRWGRTDIRLNGGSLRIDLGEWIGLDSLKFYVGDEQGLQPFKSWEALPLQVSDDLKTWKTILILAGKVMALPLDPLKPIRYVRFPGSPERVAEIEGYRNGKQVDRSKWKASNLFSQYRFVVPKEAFETSFVLDEIPKGSYLAIALDGRHGDEGAYVAIRVNGKPVGAPDRSVSYRSNAWEYPVQTPDSNYTYYIPLTADMTGAKIDAVVLVMKNGVSEFKPSVWVTTYPAPYEKRVLKLSKDSE